MQNNKAISFNRKISTGLSTGKASLQVSDHEFYERVRQRFMLQSARYLGADLNDSRILALCFVDTIQGDLNVN